MDQAIERARVEALKSAEQFRLGAVLLRRKAVVASGRNRNMNACGLQSIHAEMDALFKCRHHHAKHLHLVVVRVLRDGRTLGMSKPCDACSRALVRMGVRKVTYSAGPEHIVTATLSSAAAPSS